MPGRQRGSRRRSRWRWTGAGRGAGRGAAPAAAAAAPDDPEQQQPQDQPAGGEQQPAAVGAAAVVVAGVGSGVVDVVLVRSPQGLIASSLPSTASSSLQNLRVENDPVVSDSVAMASNTPDAGDEDEDGGEAAYFKIDEGTDEQEMEEQ